ncbi:hypothetical protein [Cytobacillus horneckiae]|uniref:Uncharacterized protein n=1 Tax=Cytobacillus horneckiae TaxID=549687 RepID=A0A2N0ZEA4_9BACI|nr:hypothetical protein [Cytobacillus horneckiae]MEC1157562.1 hypothetical protein [Cytobacillus horneckiae]MED2939510.1 hypothetical protein [Cytobacillus horneckiae]PKG27840.1 hypothetical protein CWS20_17270 [Cytobacillus horneckiae]
MNSDQRERNLPTYYDDWYTPFVQYFINNTEGFEHLIRPRKQWRMPKGVVNYRRKSILRNDYQNGRGNRSRHRRAS